MGDDKFKGNSMSTSIVLQIQECLNTCKMINIGFARPRFTWSNHRPLSNLVQERIDRVVVNPNGNNLHPKAAIYHLEKTHSNHCPIKLCFQRPQGFQPPRPFIFQPMWLSHPSLEWFEKPVLILQLCIKKLLPSLRKQISRIEQNLAIFFRGRQVSWWD